MFFCFADPLCCFQPHLPCSYLFPESSLLSFGLHLQVLLGATFVLNKLSFGFFFGGVGGGNASLEKKHMESTQFPSSILLYSQVNEVNADKLYYHLRTCADSGLQEKMVQDNSAVQVTFGILVLQLVTLEHFRLQDQSHTQVHHSFAV